MIDYAGEGTLARRLREQGAVQLELLERFGDDLLSAICHLEEKGISHRDIKPENIGLMKQGSQLHLVLFDFSLSNISAEQLHCRHRGLYGPLYPRSRPPPLG